jgi:putative ABC transport system permease protein
MRQFLLWLRGLFSGIEGDRDLDDEVRTHLELLADDYMRQGMTPKEARYAARKAFGGVEQMKEAHRDWRRIRWVEVLLQDTRYALRQLKRKPGAAITGVLTLGVSIGAVVAVFALTQNVVFRPLSYPTADRLVAIHSRVAQFGRIPVSDTQYRAWRGSLRSIDGMALLWAYEVNLSGSGDPERAAAARVSPDLFRILGVHPQLGRLLRDDEDQPGRDRVVLLSDRLWRRRFAADRQIVGKTIAMNGEPYEVVGVLQSGFSFPRVSRLYSIPVNAGQPELWKPFAIRETDPLSGLNFAAIGRLAAGVTIRQAQAELDALQRTIVPAKGPGGGNATIAGELVPLRDQILGTSRRGLEILLAAVGAVLVIACLNVTNLILFRSIARRREFAVRCAIGASRARLARQLFTEGVVLSAIAGAVGVALATVAVRLLVLRAPIDIPRLEEVRIDAFVLECAAAVTCGVALIVGLLPAARLPHSALLRGLRDVAGQGRVHDRPSRGIQGMLVVGQVAATAACAIVAGLLVQSLVGVLAVDKGFETGDVVTTQVDLAGPGYMGRRIPLQRSMIQRLEAIRGVTSVGLSSEQLLGGSGMNLRLLAEGSAAPIQERPLANIRAVSPGFFRTFGIPIQRGQVFEDGDSRPVAVVSASTAARLWPGENPVGRRFRRGPDSSMPIEVVGVAADVRASRLEQPPGLIVYLPYWQSPVAQFSMAVRAAGDTGAVGSDVRTAIRGLDSTLPLTQHTMDEIVADAVGERRFLTVLVLLFATAAMVLAALGIYGVVSQSVALRTSEIGLRMALGAQRSAIRQMVLGEAGWLVGIGLVIGVSVALASGSALRAILFGIAPSHVPTIAAVCGVVAAVATVASYAPARVACRVDAMVALKTE